MREESDYDGNALAVGAAGSGFCFIDQGRRFFCGGKFVCGKDVAGSVHYHRPHDRGDGDEPARVRSEYHGVRDEQ